MADLLAAMKAAPIWLVWRSEPDPDPSRKHRKVPYYVGGGRREGALDSPQDRARLVTYERAAEAYARLGDTYAGLAIALGPDGAGGHWQGIDLDDVEANYLGAEANAAPGYVEMSPSGKGAHAIGYGRHFASLGSNGSGVEAYAGGRFFTVTERIIRDGGLTCIASFVEQTLVPRHGATRIAGVSAIETVPVDPKTVSELRSALFHMRSDDRDLWVRMGFALKELGETGRGLWMAWSATSGKFDPSDAAKRWDGFVPRDTGFQAVFAEATRQGWVNPASAGAQLAPPPPVEPSTITLEFAMSSDTATITLEYLVDPYLPRKCVVGFYGRGSTAKSSFVATICAHTSSLASTLWVSVEEPADWIKVRHIACGGADRTLAVVTAVESKRDQHGRVIASSFNVYEHLEPAIVKASAAFEIAYSPSRPIRSVVLDTAVGLTGWAKGESPNDDAAVKKLLGYLQALAERHDVTIAIIGHANKGKHEHFADTVMGASAWTNSPRLSFVHAADRREDYAYVMRVAKTNFDWFGAAYTTERVHTLYQREEGPDTVLVRVVPGPVVWGDLASMEMFEEATKKPKDDEDNSTKGFSPRAATLVQEVVRMLERLVLATEPDQHVVRGEVQRHFQQTIDRARWLKVDNSLHLHPFVIVERGDKNAVHYKRRI